MYVFVKGFWVSRITWSSLAMAVRDAPGQGTTGTAQQHLQSCGRGVHQCDGCRFAAGYFIIYYSALRIFAADPATRPKDQARTWVWPSFRTMLRFGVWLLEFGVWFLEFWVWLLEFGVWILEFRFWILDGFNIRSSFGSPQNSRLAFGNWILVHFGFWSLAFGVWVLEFGCWSLAVMSFGFMEFWLLEFGCWSLAFGVWILDCGVWLLEFGFWSLAFGFWMGFVSVIHVAAPKLCRLDLGVWSLDGLISIHSSCSSPKRSPLDFGAWILFFGVCKLLPSFGFCIR